MPILPAIRLILISSCAALLLLTAACQDSSEPATSPASKAAENGKAAIGQPAPDFTLKAVDGRSISLSSLRGKVVLVNFWATWCPPCREEMPSMEELYKNYAPGGLELLAINIEEDGPEFLPEFMREHPHSFPVLYDTEGAVRERYGVFQFPETFVVGRDGVIVDKVVGGIDWTSPRVLSEMNRHLRVPQ
jgi:peroxiredoxin